MNNPAVNKLNGWIALFLRSPLVWGGLVSGLYYAAVYSGAIDNPMLLRFTAGHIVEYIVTVAFFVGVAALGVKAVELLAQRSFPEQPLLGAMPEGNQQSAADAAALLARLDEAPAHLRGGYLVHRLREALEHVRRSGHADTLDAEIKYLSDLEAIHAQHGYAFVRVIIWAIPILGLLGTVIGITSVFANIDIKHFDASLPHVLSGLQVAFDTTGLALAMSMTLMFVQYFVDRLEQGLLTNVDARVNAELVGRFAVSGKDGSGGAASDQQLIPLRRMMETVVQGTERLVARQAEIWRTTIDAADERSSQLAARVSSNSKEALAAAMQQSLKVARCRPGRRRPAVSRAKPAALGRRAAGAGANRRGCRPAASRTGQTIRRAAESGGSDRARSAIGTNAESQSDRAGGRGTSMKRWSPWPRRCNFSAPGSGRATAICGR